MDVALGMVLGMVVALSLGAGWRLVFTRGRVPAPGAAAMQAPAPLLVHDRSVGTLVALYDRPGPLRLEESRVVTEAAALVAALVQLSEVEAQAERLARAELRSLRAQISPHFIYNALAAVAAFIHSRPEDARELLTEFPEFIRYGFGSQRPYVTLADE